MKSREIVRKTITFESPQRIPRQIWLLPWAEEQYPETVLQLQKRFPDDIVNAPSIYKKTPDRTGDKYKIGSYTDEWGCTFENIHDGVIGIVREPLVREWEDLERLKTPEAMLSVDADAVNGFCKETDKFVLAGTGTRPFERLQFLRTMERAMIDLSEQPADLLELLHRIHDHYLKEFEIWAQTDVDGIAFMDDWGTQNSMMISPNIFRRIFKPMYREYVETAHHNGKYVFFHSDGVITDIIPDLIEIGIDALNSQIFCMGIKELGDRFRGKITFWGEIDRQQLLPRGSREDIEQAVKEVWEYLYENGGIIAQCEFGPGARPENVIAVFDTWDWIDHSRKKPS